MKRIVIEFNDGMQVVTHGTNYAVATANDISINSFVVVGSVVVNSSAVKSITFHEDVDKIV